MPLRSMAVAHRRRSAAAINRSAATKGAQMLRGLTTVNFWAADMAAAKKWYTELLGFGPYFERPRTAKSWIIGRGNSPFVESPGN